MLGEMLQNVRENRPLVHCITNYVTANDCANLLLACGGSAIMADEMEEVEEVTSLCGGLVLNLGTPNPRKVEAMLRAGREANRMGRPVVFDPVGVGCSAFRREASSRILEQVQLSVIRGNASEIAALTGGETVADAYCGAGTIGLSLARRARRVVGIEIVEPAVRDAKENARRNGVTNAEFYAGPCEKLLPQLASKGLKFDAVVLDPPRKGCDEAVLRAAAQTNPARIVYVSCDPGTLARDVKQLTQHGYTLTQALAVDMFPQTPHVETVALLNRISE